jgi:hypothetical protein
MAIIENFNISVFVQATTYGLKTELKELHVWKCGSEQIGPVKISPEILTVLANNGYMRNTYPITFLVSVFLLNQNIKNLCPITSFSLKSDAIGSDFESSDLAQNHV